MAGRFKRTRWVLFGILCFAIGLIFPKDFIGSTLFGIALTRPASNIAVIPIDVSVSEVNTGTQYSLSLDKKMDADNHATADVDDYRDSKFGFEDKRSGAAVELFMIRSRANPPVSQWTVVDFMIENRSDTTMRVPSGDWCVTERPDVDPDIAKFHIRNPGVFNDRIVKVADIKLGSAENYARTALEGSGSVSIPPGVSAELHLTFDDFFVYYRAQLQFRLEMDGGSGRQYLYTVGLELKPYPTTTPRAI